MPWFALGAVFTVLGTVFTLSPEFLSHSPVGFESRGFVHHVFFHYMIWLGGAALVLGISSRDSVFEVLGLVGCLIPTTLNLAAILSAEDIENTSGFDIALRVVVIAFVIARLNEIRSEGR